MAVSEAKAFEVNHLMGLTQLFRARLGNHRTGGLETNQRTAGWRKISPGSGGILQVKRWEIHKAWVKKWPHFFLLGVNNKKESHIYTNYYSRLVVRHGSWSNEPWMGEKHMKWNCEVKQRKLAKKRLETTWLQCKVSHLFYEFYCQTICIGKISAKFPTENICVFGRWRSFMYIDFENLRLDKHLSKKNTTWDHFFSDKQKNKDAIFRCSINDGWFEADATIWLKSTDVSDRYSDGCFTLPTKSVIN